MVGFLPKRARNGSYTTNAEVCLGHTSLVRLTFMVVRSRLGGIETESVQEVDIRLRAMRFIILVDDRRDLAQVVVLLKLLLNGKELLHG